MNADHSENKYVVPEGFSMNPWFLTNDLPLSQGARFTYAVLATCSYRRDYGWATLDFIARKIAASQRTVRRYLDELVEAKFIELTKEKLMGDRRLIYRFLNNVYMDFENVKAEREDPPLRFEDLQKENQGGRPGSSDKNAVEMSGKNDKNDTRLYKEEYYQGKEEIIPPYPPADDSAQDATAAAVPSDAGKVGVDIYSEEEKQPSASDWARAKKILAEELSAFDLQAYIAPLVFERRETRAVLRVPNSCLLHLIKQRLGEQLHNTFKKLGFAELCFEEFTPEQMREYDRRTNEAERRAEALKEAAQQIADERIDFGALPLEELFDRLYDLYPCKERRKKSFLVFERMALANQLPPMPRLLNTVRWHKNNNPKWQREEGRYVPQLHRWLYERRWED